MKLSNYLAPAAAPILPWALLGLVLAWGGSLAGVAWWAHRDGAAAPKAQCEADKAKAIAAAASWHADEVAAAAKWSARIVSGLADVAAARAQTRAKTRAIAQEVSHAVDQAPDLGRTVLPAAVLQLRDQQVSDSTAAAAAARRAAGQ
jgi:hypothetical protein